MKLSEAFAKPTYRQRRDNPTVTALAAEYIDMIETHGGLEEMDLDADDLHRWGGWGTQFERLMDHLTDIYIAEVIKKVKEHYNNV